MKYLLSDSQKAVLQTHSRGITRRDLFGIGVKSFAGLVTTRSFLSNIAYGSFSDAGLPSYLTIDLVGGAALSGNFLVTDAFGSLLPSYSTLGFNPATSTLDNRFGISAPADKSKIFSGMIERMSADAQVRTRITSIAHFSLDDGNVNTTSALGHVAKLYASEGQFRQKGLGTEGTSSGGNTKLSFDISSIRPEQLSNLDQLQTYSGLLSLEKSGIKGSDLKRFMSRQRNDYLNQFRMLASDDQMALKDSFEKAMDSYLGSITRVELDSRKVDSLRTIFKVSSTDLATNKNALSASIAYACLTGKVGPSCIALGGYDYHDGTQTTGDAKDLEAGRLIGSILQLAHTLQKPVFLQIISDGSVAARPNTRIWTSDSGSRSLTLMICYSPQSEVTQVKSQLGGYTSGEVADASTFVGKDSQRSAHVTFLNYLSMLGRQNEIVDYLTDGEMPISEIDQNIAFTP